MNLLIVFLRSLTTDRYARERPANQGLWALIALGVFVAVALLARGIYELWQLLR